MIALVAHITVLHSLRDAPSEGPGIILANIDDVPQCLDGQLRIRTPCFCRPKFGVGQLLENRRSITLATDMTKTSCAGNPTAQGSITHFS